MAGIDPVMARAQVLQCAEIVGAGEAILDLAVGYAKDRVQFGRPIGQYQAVQYLCSDIAIDMHLSSLLSREAAWLIDEGKPSTKEVSMAKASASKAAQHMVHQAHEVHAGAAFMLEHDLQLYSRRAKHWEFNLGNQTFHEEQIAQALEA
jgi:alkylation response protein AidB-like acyl-CoA dehydrogenase